MNVTNTNSFSDLDGFCLDNYNAPPTNTQPPTNASPTKVCDTSQPLSQPLSQPPPQQPLEPFISPAIPRYLSNYSSIFNAVMGVKDLVSEWQPPTEKGSYELEARLGTFTVGGFSPGVTHNFMEGIVSMLNSCNLWSKVTEWTETHDYYYKLASDANNKPLVRTTAHFEIDESTGQKTLHTSHIRKYVKQKLDYRYVSQTAQLSTDQFQYDLRVVLNYEEKVNQKNLPPIINPQLVRIKNRKRYLYKSENFPSPSPIWSLDLTRSWTGKTKSEAESNQKENTPVYEVEVECMNPSALMVSENHDNFYVACSLLLKIRDFIMYTAQGGGGDTFSWEPVQKFSNTMQDQIVNAF